MTADERWEKEFKKAEKDWLENTPDPSKEIEDMITKWFKVLDSDVSSDNKDWSIKGTGIISLTAKVFYKGNEVCDIIDHLNGELTFTPTYDEWHYVAESAVKVFQSVDKTFVCKIVENEDLDMTQQDEHRER